MNSSYLKCDNLGKRYGRRWVVRGVDLMVRPGEVVGILGPNGAGKSTTFKMIMGVVRADTGQVILNGQDITNLPLYRRARLGLGYLPQEPSIFRGLTCRENLLVPVERLGLDRSIVDRMLKEFELEQLSDSVAESLSGGERRRLEIARILITDPKFLLLDEPLAGIDPKTIVEVTKLVLRLKERGIGVIITDHNVRDIMDICDTMYILFNGVVIAYGKSDEVLKDESVRRHFLGGYGLKNGA